MTSKQSQANKIETINFSKIVLEQTEKYINNAVVKHLVDTKHKQKNILKVPYLITFYQMSN